MECLKTVREIQKKAMNSDMSIEAKTYFSVAAGNNESRRTNEKAFERFHIRPLILRNVSTVDPSISLLGNKVSFPIGLSPTGFHHLAHPDAEVATAFASSKEECLMIVSIVSSKSLSEIAQKCPNGSRWLQLYIFKDRSLTVRLAKMAEAYGYSGLVITADSPVGGLWRLKMPESFFSKVANTAANLPETTAGLLDPSVEFADLKWLKSVTRLPIVVKGVTSGRDAVKSIKHGASAILVSNHGGRQIDGVVPTIQILEEVVNAVKRENPAVEVYVDGGIRTGSDVFKACALGARAVFIGKPVTWGLAVGGEDGVRRVLQILKQEFLLTMQLAGARNLKEITKAMIAKDECSCKL